MSDVRACACTCLRTVSHLFLVCVHLNVGVRVPRCSADREKKLSQVFAAAKLDGASMATMNGRGVEVAVRNATQGEGWVDDVQKVVVTGRGRGRGCARNRHA
jgi:hypothetical protein